MPELLQLLPLSVHLSLECLHRREQRSDHGVQRRHVVRQLQKFCGELGQWFGRRLAHTPIESVSQANESMGLNGYRSGSSNRRRQSIDSSDAQGRWDHVMHQVLTPQIRK